MYFRDDEGKFISRAQFCALEKMVEIPDTTRDYDKAYERLEALRHVEINVAAMICAANRDGVKDTTVSWVYCIRMFRTGELRHYNSSHAIEKASIWEAFNSCLRGRIERQEKICSEMEQMSAELL